MPKTKTVTVRIAVAVDPEGHWASCGYDGCTDSLGFSNCIDTLGAGERRYILTKELEVPEVTELEADAERVEER